MLENLLFSLITFVLVFVLYYGTVISRKKKLSKYRNSTEIKLLEFKYKVNIDGLDLKKLGLTLSLVNAFIMALTVFIVINITNNVIYQLLLGFVTLIVLIIVVYSFVGKYFKKKEGNSHVQPRKNRK